MPELTRIKHAPSHPIAIPVLKEDVTASEWSAIKSLWNAVQDADPQQRDSVLANPEVSANVRRQVEQLLAASLVVGDRFEQPAAALLKVDTAPDESSTDASAVSMVGRRLGPYQVIRRIGQGGMGAVYEAVRSDDSYQQRVAIKTIWRGADSGVLLQRFRSERQILAGLQHPNIAALLDGGATDEGSPWLAMEYVDGLPIDAYCDQHELALPARLDLFRQVCAAVHFAHRSLVVHRDLKPSNVLVTPDGTVKLLDFGVAKLLDDPREEGTLTHAGLAPYTASYAAPEQVVGGAISTATDVYALGALLVTLLTGRPPLDARSMTIAQLVESVRSEPAVPPSELVLDVSHAVSRESAVMVAHERGFPSLDRLAQALRGELDAIALMALRKEPERRYASVDALSEDVHRYLRRDRVLARPDTLTYRLRAFVRRQRPLVVASALALAVAVVAGLSVAWQARRAASERATAQARLREVRTLASALLYDANDKLADIPGATTARVGLVRTALQALDSASIDSPRDAALLRELALAYSRAGDVLGNPTQASSGDLPGAASAYSKAIKHAELLMKEQPDDPNSAWTLALVYEKAADVEAPMGHITAALQHQRASLALFRRISAADTMKYGAVRAVGISSLKTGDLLGHPSFTNMGDTSAAIEAYRESIVWLERARALGDTSYLVRRHRAVARERLGRLMQERRDFAEARRWLDESLLLRDSLLLEAPRSVQARRDVAIALYLLCGMHLQNAHPELATPPCERSLAIRRALLDEDPKSPVLGRGMGIIQARLGDVYAQRGDSAAALDAYAQSAAFYERFFNGRAGAINDRRDYVTMQLQRGAVASASASGAASRVADGAYAAALASLDSIGAMAKLSTQDSLSRDVARKGRAVGLRSR